MYKIGWLGYIPYMSHIQKVLHFKDAGKKGFALKKTLSDHLMYNVSFYLSNTPFKFILSLLS